jgi:predicted transposase/invertase (TIGR01784 family)
MSDMIVIINGTHVYHLEAEIGDDENIVIRMFEYGFAEGLRTKTLSESGQKITIKCPNARVIYWETTKRTPDEVVLSLEFSDGTSHDYTVKTFKFLDHTIKELEEKKAVILLPFYVLKLRKRAMSERNSKRRTELCAEMKEILDELLAAVERAVNVGLMSEPDSRTVLEHTERLYKELYQGYDEFKEADVMLQNMILTYSEEAELRGIEKGREKGREEGREEGIEKKAFEVVRKMLARGMDLADIAEIVELPIDTIQAGSGGPKHPLPNM